MHHLAYYNQSVFMVFLANSLLYGGLVLLFLRQRCKLDYKRFALSSQTQSNTVQMIQGMQDIKSLPMPKRPCAGSRVQTRSFKLSMRGLALGPQYNFGKVMLGQRVLTKFNGYPYQEFGMVEGRVEFISEIPARDSVFMAYVRLPHGLVTNYRQKLVYHTGMTATAEIITEDMRLLERLFHNFRRAAA